MIRRLTCLCAVVVGLGIILPVPASAGPDSCSQRLDDTAAILGPDTSMLRCDVDTLARDGAMVRVRTYGALPSGGMDAAEKKTEDSCPSWRSGGERKDKLLVLTVSRQDRRTGLYYGSAYADKLDDQWTKIQEKSMNPEFKRGRYASGLDQGVLAVHERITGSSGSSSGALVIILVMVPVALVVVLIVLAIRRHKRSSPGGGPGHDSSALVGGTAVATSAAASSAATSASAGGGSTSF